MAPKERYQQQLEDKRWIFKAENIRIRDKHKCRLCGTTKAQLDVHHIRYIDGREAWDYDDGDLVTLCHNCHEEVHDGQDYDKLIPGSYFYNKNLEGVGIVEYKQTNSIWFHACWAETDQNEGENHGRLYIEDEAPREAVRIARPNEIKDFWEKVEKYYSISNIIFDFGKYLKDLLPDDHSIRVKARKYYKEALKIYEEQKKYVKEKFGYYLLVSDDNYAAFDDNRLLGSLCKWPATEVPIAFFHVASKKDVLEKPQQDNSRHVAFKDFDFAGYRAATFDEVNLWSDYTEHLFDLHEDDLPF